MALIPVDEGELRSIAIYVLNECFTIRRSEYPAVQHLMDVQITANAKKYVSLGLHYIVTSDYTNYIDLLKNIVTPYAKDEYIKLLSMTDNLSEFTSIPVKDGSHFSASAESFLIASRCSKD